VRGESGVLIACSERRGRRAQTGELRRRLKAVWNEAAVKSATRFLAVTSSLWSGDDEAGRVSREVPCCCYGVDAGWCSLDTMSATASKRVANAAAATLLPRADGGGKRGAKVLGSGEVPRGQDDDTRGGLEGFSTMLCPCTPPYARQTTAKHTKDPPTGIVGMDRSG
jgi:hypothetical protein